MELDQLKKENILEMAEEYEITGAMMRLKVFSQKEHGYNLISQASFIILMTRRHFLFYLGLFCKKPLM